MNRLVVPKATAGALLPALLCLLLAGAAHAAMTPAPRVERLPFGSGLQNATGTENAELVGDFGVWHVPQYLPGYPTAAPIWPRVIELRCVNGVCAGYTITPELGRGEYLFFRVKDK